MDAFRSLRSSRRACVRRAWNPHALALLAATTLALAACATHPRPQSPPPPPLPARTAHSVPAPRTRARVPQTPQTPQAPAAVSGESLAPADVGYYMDVLQGRLRQAVGKGVAVGRQGNRIVLDLTSRIAFGPGGIQLGAGDHAIIASLARVLVEYRMTELSVRVRAADPATHAIDPRLSQQRAQAIGNDLAGAGVAPGRIAVAGVGADKRVQVVLSIEPIVH